MPPKQARWTAKCDAARILLEMLQSKEITGQEKPSVVQAKNSEFSKFSADTFRKRYRETVDNFSQGSSGKKLFKRSTLAQLLFFRIFADNFVDDSSMHSVAEFSGLSANRSRMDFDVSHDKNESNNTVVKKNVQAISYSFEDPDTNNQFVVVAVVLHGLQPQDEIRRKIVEDEGEQYLEIREKWHAELLDGKSLFKDEPNLLSYHPKAVALKNELKKVRQHFTEVPEEIIRVKLAARVVEDMSTWTEYIGKLSSGSCLLRITFKALQPEYSMDQQKEFIKLRNN